MKWAWESDDHEKKQDPELLQNFIMSSQIEGSAASDTIQAMCLSILNRERTLEECLNQLNVKYSEG